MNLTLFSIDGKCLRPSACSALVDLRGGAAACALVAGMLPASDANWDAEYLDVNLAVRIVDDRDAAIAHISLNL